MQSKWDCRSFVCIICWTVIECGSKKALREMQGWLLGGFRESGGNFPHHRPSAVVCQPPVAPLAAIVPTVVNQTAYESKLQSICLLMKPNSSQLSVDESTATSVASSCSEKVEPQQLGKAGPYQWQRHHGKKKTKQSWTSLSFSKNQMTKCVFVCLFACFCLFVFVFCFDYRATRTRKALLSFEKQMTRSSGAGPDSNKQTRIQLAFVFR